MKFALAALAASFVAGFSYYECSIASGPILLDGSAAAAEPQLRERLPPLEDVSPVCALCMNIYSELNMVPVLS